MYKLQRFATFILQQILYIQFSCYHPWSLQEMLKVNVTRILLQSCTQLEHLTTKCYRLQHCESGARPLRPEYTGYSPNLPHVMASSVARAYSYIVIYIVIYSYMIWELCPQWGWGAARKYSCYGSLVRRVTGPKGTERRFPEHNGEKCSCQFMYSL